MFRTPTKSPRGFTILFAALVASLLLAVGAAIYTITSREVIFASVAKNSDFALYVADTGVECAEYWDNNCPADQAGCKEGSAFATSSQSTPPSSGIICNDQDVAKAPWTVVTGASAATTTFNINFSAQPGVQPSCATVEVARWSPAASVIKTKIISEGFNTCNTDDPNRLERELQVTY